MSDQGRSRSMRGLRRRFRYRVDDVLGRGIGAPLLVLGGITLVVVLVASAILTALNLDFAWNVCLLGTSTFVWLRGHRLHGFACFFGAAVVVLGAPFFLRVLAGALSVLGTVAWWPLASLGRA